MSGSSEVKLGDSVLILKKKSHDVSTSPRSFSSE